MKLSLSVFSKLFRANGSLAGRNRMICNFLAAA